MYIYKGKYCHKKYFSLCALHWEIFFSKELKLYRIKKYSCKSIKIKVGSLSVMSKSFNNVFQALSFSTFTTRCVKYPEPQLLNL